jgi:hypothetical protein
MFQQQNVLYTPPDYTVEYPLGERPSSISIPTTSKNLPVVLDAFYITHGGRYKLARTDPDPGAGPAFELEEITSVVTGQYYCYLSPKFHTEEYQFGYGSSSMIHLRVKSETQGRDLIYSFVEKVFPGGSDEAMEGSPPASSLMVADLIPGDGTDVWVSVCSTSGRMLVMDCEGLVWASLENVPRVYEFVR